MSDGGQMHAIDIRWPIGALFAAMGLTLTTYGAVHPSFGRVVPLRINLNVWWGLVLVFSSPDSVAAVLSLVCNPNFYCAPYQHLFRVGHHAARLPDPGRYPNSIHFFSSKMNFSVAWQSAENFESVFPCRLVPESRQARFPFCGAFPARSMGAGRANLVAFRKIERGSSWR